jgi:hypothetical protein
MVGFHPVVAVSFARARVEAADVNRAFFRRPLDELDTARGGDRDVLLVDSLIDGDDPARLFEVHDVV